VTQLTVAGLTTRLEEAQKDFLQVLRGIHPSVFAGVPSSDDWTVAQIVGHATEIQTFWMGQAERIVRESDPTIGRLTQPDKQSRSHAVGEGAPRDPQQAAERFKSIGAETLRRLRAFKDADLARQGHRPDGTAVSAGQLIEGSIVDHVAEHARQIREMAKSSVRRAAP